MDRDPPDNTEGVEDAAVRAEAERRAVLAERDRRRNRRLKALFPFVLFLVFVVYSFTTNYIPSKSMAPTLRPGDHILTMRGWLAYPGGRSPRRDDIVVFVMPETNARDTPADPPPNGIPLGSLRHLKGDILIKRVAGLPGETIRVAGSRVWIDGTEVDRPRIPAFERESIASAAPYAFDRPLTLKQDQIFVLGDNPAVSDDSRFWGPLNRHRIVGRFVCLLFHEGAEGPNRKNDDKTPSD